MKKNEIVIINNNKEKIKEEIKQDEISIKNSEQEIIKTPEEASINDNKENLGIDISKSNLINYKTNLNITENEEDKKKEFFINHTIIYFFIRILLLFEGQIMRILVQIGDLYIIGIITNIYLEIIVIQMCAVADSNVFAVIFGFISALIFCFLMKNVVSIAFWELYQLKWVDLNPFGTLMILLNIKLKHYMTRNIYYITYIILGIIFWVFIASLLTMYWTNSQFFDAMTLIIFVIIPGLKFLSIYLCYIYIFFRRMIKKENNEINEQNPFIYWLKLSDLIDQGVIKVGNTTNEETENASQVNNNINNNIKNGEGSKLSCWKKIFFKDIIFEIKLCKEKKISLSLIDSLKIFFTLFSFIYIIYLFAKKGATVGSVFFLIITYLFSLIIWIQFPTPSWFTNSIYRWCLKCKNKYDRKYQLKCRVFNEKFGVFKFIDSLPLILSILIWVIFIGTIIFFAIIDPLFVSSNEKINQDGRNFTRTDWPREYFSEIKNVENSICFTEIHGLSMLKLISFSFATYMYDADNVLIYLKDSIFKENIEQITNFKYLNVESKYARVLMTDIDIPGKKPLTVFTIQASIKRLDYWLDLEIFLSSGILTICRILSINKYESLTSRVITWFLTIPLRTMEKFTLFKVYLDHLDDEIDGIINNIKDDRNIIFTGHSLGGGMAKYLGLKYHKESVAVSGPGIASLEYKFKDKRNYYKYFKSNFIDVVPDHDIVPRLESSGGIRYRVLCEKGFITCHLIERILCQVGAMCRREDLVGDLCMTYFGKDKYKEIRDLAGIKSPIPSFYRR
jgi:hypothetical protein